MTKKGFYFSLACVGLLGTMANAEITDLNGSADIIGSKSPYTISNFKEKDSRLIVNSKDGKNDALYFQTVNKDFNHNLSISKSNDSSALSQLFFLKDLTLKTMNLNIDVKDFLIDKATLKAETLDIQGNIDNFLNDGTLESSKITLNANGSIKHFNNNGIMKNINITSENGAISGFVNNKIMQNITIEGLEAISDFVNKGEITSSIFNDVNNFVNEKTGTIKDTSLTVAYSFENEGSIIGKEGASLIKITDKQTHVEIINNGIMKIQGNGSHVELGQDSEAFISHWNLDLGKVDATNFNKLGDDINHHIVVKNATKENFKVENDAIKILNPKLGEKYLYDSILINDKKESIKGIVTKNSVSTMLEDGTFQMQKDDQGFTVSVEVAQSSGVAVTQNAIASNIARSSFVSNVVSNAISAVSNSFSSVSGSTRTISLNDSNDYISDVNLAKLDRYAQVSSDVLDRTYAPLTTNNNSHIFAMPYYTHTQADLNNKTKLKGNTYGLIAGMQQNLQDYGILGFFLGTEINKADSKFLDQDDLTFYGGVNYYKSLYTFTNSNDLFFKGMLRGTYTKIDLTQRSSGVEGDTDTNSNSYGAEIGFGVNFYKGNSTLTPEIALSYDRVNSDGFTSPVDKSVAYDDNNINSTMLKVGVSWDKNWSERVSTNLGGGVRFNLKNEFTTSVITNKIRNNGEVALEDMYSYINASLTYNINQSFDITATYNGDFADDTRSHSGYLKLGYWW